MDKDKLLAAATTYADEVLKLDDAKGRLDMAMTAVDNLEDAVRNQENRVAEAKKDLAIIANNGRIPDEYR